MYCVFVPQEKNGDFLDCFIPNPGCDELHMFRWLGVLMGGVFRSDESLTLSFPPFVWKLLAGEHVTWAKDYVAIDEAAVHITGKRKMRTQNTALSQFTILMLHVVIFEAVEVIDRYIFSCLLLFLPG